jgi:hypothetical protein
MKTKSPKRIARPAQVQRLNVVDADPLLVTNLAYARLIGVTSRTLYTYEQRGILSPSRKINGRKFRDPKEMPKFDKKAAS